MEREGERESLTILATNVDTNREKPYQWGEEVKCSALTILSETVDQTKQKKNILMHYAENLKHNDERVSSIRVRVTVKARARVRARARARARTRIRFGFGLGLGFEVGVRVRATNIMYANKYSQVEYTQNGSRSSISIGPSQQSLSMKRGRKVSDQQKSPFNCLTSLSSFIASLKSC
jgi:hypothetical protein